MKPHEFRELVNELRDTAIKYRTHQQLRERIVDVLLAHGVFPDVLRRALAAAPEVES